ncbi:uncharacterized protein F5147DRAFT_775227 [Suillus discolor]|uniref:Uncharacterized protein n=1 Tax=Suillus discolor TaxID=1912936 RepID=A0A9P7F3P0_9AGAM|nr:uncharacterized protein F5147DRAFT_775227 [Suillus discolor]KAG2105458.1 hypothetical protein F5147DRAFT_775227 [Suillus discolor]
MNLLETLAVSAAAVQFRTTFSVLGPAEPFRTVLNSDFNATYLDIDRTSGFALYSSAFSLFGVLPFAYGEW